MTAPCCEPGCTAEVLCPVHQALTDLRAKVLGLTTLPLGGWDVVFLKDVLALLPEEKP